MPWENPTSWTHTGCESAVILNESLKKRWLEMSDIQRMGYLYEQIDRLFSLLIEQDIRYYALLERLNIDPDSIEESK